MSKVAVIGLGYVGLPLAILADEKKFEVVGIDSNVARVRELKSNKTGLEDSTISSKLKKAKIHFTSDYSVLKDIDIAIVCVPTPVDENKMPNLSIVKAATLSAAKNLKDESLLIIESTINPGVCDEVLIPAIESETKHKIGKTLHVAHCPERINPGDKKWHVGNIARVLGANSSESLKFAYDFYNQLVDAEIKKMSNIKEAEACKVVENSFRDINIAFVNELAMSFEKLGINVMNVIDGAATKPFAFMAHYPGIGVGGHCIPVDPYYLIEYAKGNGFEHDFLSLARKINENMPIYAIEEIEKTLIEQGLGNMKNKKVAILGLSYKPNVGDERESPAISLISNLEARGAMIDVYDPFIKQKSTVDTLEEATKNKDVVVLVTAHDEFKNLDITGLQKEAIFYDGRNKFLSKKQKFHEQGVHYLGVGA